LSWADLFKHSREYRYSPFPRIILRIYQEFRSWTSATSENYNNYTNDNNPSHARKEPIAFGPLIEGAISREISLLEKRLIFLSTTVSVSPFLGLLGTVWGIMTAFINMGMRGSANIAAVGPGIAEALITTAAGLAVAIPALFAYNYFVDRLRKISDELDIFSAELLQLVERERSS